MRRQYKKIKTSKEQIKGINQRRLKEMKGNYLFLLFLSVNRDKAGGTSGLGQEGTMEE